MRIAIIGASINPERMSNKAVKAYLKKGWDVVPVTPMYEEVEGIPAVKRVLDCKDIDVASFYVKPEVGLKVADDVIKKGIKKVFLNPGAESEELTEKLKTAGIEVREACSIVAVGND